MFLFHKTRTRRKFSNKNQLCHTKSKTITTSMEKPGLACKHCHKRFVWKSGLSRHIQLFHMQEQQKLFTCEICDKSFYKKVGLTLHLKKHATKRPVENDFKSSEKISQMYADSVTEIVYSSDSDCEYEIVQTVIKIDGSKIDGFYNCFICSKSFSKADNLDLHMKKHPNAEIKEKSDLQLDDTSNNLVESVKEEEGITDNTLPEDIMGHSSIQTQTLEQLEEISEKNVSQIFNCLICSKVYSCKIFLKQHLKSHSKIGKTSCNVCGKEIEKRRFNIHMASHTGVKAHLCTVCGKRFTRAGYLTIHMRIHNNYKPFLCSVCGKSFTVKRYLIVHQRVHTHERPFICCFCEKGFVQKGNLTEHLRTHTGLKPHKCTLCSKTFAHYSGLNQHLRIHNGVKNHACRICNKRFSNSGHYREHIRIHSGERPNVCSVCKKAFTNNSSLIVHMRTHSGERPFRCDVCSKSFIKSYGLKQHRKNHKDCGSKSDTRSPVH